MDYAYTIFCIIGASVCFISVYFIWQIPGRPWSTLLLITWLFTYNIFSAVDSIVWEGDDLSGTPDGVGYCDVSARLKTVFPLGVLGCTISLCLFLLEKSNSTSLRRRKEDPNRVRRNIADVCLGVVMPLLFIIFKFIVEPSRYVIVGVMGCQGTFDTSWPTIPLYFMWPPLLTLIAFAMIVMLLYHWYIRRRDPRMSFPVGPNGISEVEFLQLASPLIYVIANFLPLSLFLLIQFLMDRQDAPPFSWSRIHGSQYNLIYKYAHPNAPWYCWIQILLAISPIFAILARPSVVVECCVEWLYDHSPIGLQVNLPSWRLVSVRCKERRQASKTGSNYETRVRRVPWTDWDYDMLDARSTPSSYITVMRYEEEIAKQTKVRIDPLWMKTGTVTIVQADGRRDSSLQETGIIVSKEAVVQTSPRSSVLKS